MTVTKSPEWREAENALLEQYQARKAELEPLLVEYDELENRIAALDPSAPRARRRFSTSSTRRVARGEHDQRFLGIVAEHPEGMKIPDVVQVYRDRGYDTPNAGQYLYKVAERNVVRGNVRKDDQGRFFVLSNTAEEQEDSQAV